MRPSSNSKPDGLPLAAWIGTAIAIAVIIGGLGYAFTESAKRNVTPTSQIAHRY
jgi:hypothetical protein